MDEARERDGERTYLCIDLKTFYASVECIDRGLDPFLTKLVVADPTRGDTTICLAISPAMKALGVRNRCRIFEIPRGIEYIKAMPRMRRYMEVSARIYGVYLRYVSPDDIHPYSIDECFIDATPYLKLYDIDARSFAEKLMSEVRRDTGVCATAGIGPNLFLAKVALDITAKHVADNIGVLDEESFRAQIWPHRPITDIWGIGPGIAARLAKYHVYDLMGVAALDEQILYREFGVNAEYLIDHAFGREPTTIAEIQAYRPAASSYVNGQVLPCNYTFEEAHTVLKEMIDASVLELVERGQVTNHISLSVGYAAGAGGTTTGDGLASPSRANPGDAFVGEHGKRRLGPKGYGRAGGSRKLAGFTNSYRKLMAAFDELWSERVSRDVPIRRMSVGLGNLVPEEFATIDLFTDMATDEREHDLQRAVLAVKGKFGKNALLRGMSLTEKATARERNEQVGGHHA
ncbi:DNA repair protein [Enorma massiliensis]|uniref:Y-family DNA polymerase n=1 Tax=Enorma massiliensis TaxID=1472761 RepID=UPI00195BB7FC|nr:DNA repair protein [Enorma massiliensis]MBM6783304.1 DNA repair protein [Enorma massiliensis]